MRRLSVIDGIFLRTHAGMGTPIALQGLWRTADPVDPGRLDRLHAALRVGPLGRRVVRSGVPGARDRWQPSIRAHPVDMAPAPIPVDEILPWADGRGADLDPRHGPGWRLSAAPVTDGGTVVALTCSHVLADARGLVIAVEKALGALGENDTGPGLSPGRDSCPGSSTEAGGDPGSDWADAADIWTTVLIGTARAARIVLRRGRFAGRIRFRRRSREISASTPGRSRPGWETGSGEVRTASGPAGNAPRESSAAPISGSAVNAAESPAIVDRDAGENRNNATGAETPGGDHGTPGVDHGMPAGGHAADSGTGDPAGTAGLPVPALVLRCPAREWDRVAAVSGGTANSLFVWFVANTLWAAGFPERDIVASLPVDTRDEPRIDNDLAMTEIVVAPGDEPGAIRAKSRAAYERRISSPGGLPEEFLHIVPDRVAYLLSRGAGERDILCSNIGTIPAPLHALGPHDCTGVAARAIHPGLTYARRPRTRLSGYLCRFHGDYLLTLASLDPARVSGAAELQRLAAATAQRISLPVVPW
ncbi:hypothetical protein [Nocardia carnea]|uniref:hypothetical protein n=1 Tax=Nocardia carnea TaxID=37328 RepID=UPI002456CA22|nr:hypothetical protein [Nocardia carnea]